MDLEEDSELDEEDLPDCHILISVVLGGYKRFFLLLQLTGKSMKRQYGQLFFSMIASYTLLIFFPCQTCDT